jgi:hypothetical protein
MPIISNYRHTSQFILKIIIETKQGSITGKKSITHTRSTTKLDHTQQIVIRQTNVIYNDFKAQRLHRCSFLALLCIAQRLELCINRLN